VRLAVGLYLEVNPVDQFVDCFKALVEGLHEKAREVVVDVDREKVIVARDDRHMLRGCAVLVLPRHMAIVGAQTIDDHLVRLLPVVGSGQDHHRTDLQLMLLQHTHP